jgi:hypothetical protein
VALKCGLQETLDLVPAFRLHRETSTTDFRKLRLWENQGALR